MKVFVVMDEDGITDVISTSETTAMLDHMVLKHWFSKSPAMRYYVENVSDDVPLPPGRWWPNMNEYMESFGITLIKEDV